MIGALAGFAPAVPRGAVVGILVQGGEAGAERDLEAIGVTQYALTPVRVRGIPWSDCAAAGPAACGMGDVHFLVVGARPPDELAAWGAQLGFPLVAAMGTHFALLARRGP